MPGIDKGGSRSKYCRKRLIPPKKCSPGSFRVKNIKKDVKLTLCCPKGKYDRKGKVCKVGTIAQSIMKRKLKSGACPKM